MNILNITLINLKKLRVQRGKAMFLIIPIFVMAAIVTVVSSQLKNFQSAVDVAIFSTLAEQATLVQIVKTPSLPTQRTGEARSFQEQNFNSNFSESDLEVIKNIADISSASLNVTVPVQNATSTDLFENVTYNASSLKTLDQTSATLFTSEPFSYTEGEAVPIILSSNTFNQSYEDWGDSTEITLNFSELRNARNTTSGNESFTNPTPIKTIAIEYLQEYLIGKTFTINFGELDTIQTYSVTNSEGNMVFKKLTTEEIAAKESARIDAIDDYWNYAALAEPVTFTFKVVGITDNGNYSYVPELFANTVMQQLIQKQLNAKIADPSSDLLDKLFLGISFDGTEFSNSTGFGFTRSIRVDGAMGTRPGQNIAMQLANPENSYTIPGLIIKTSSDGSNTVEGIYSDTNAFENSVKSSTTITLKVNSIYNRANVISAINQAGYAVLDSSDFSIFEQIQSTIKNISILLLLGFIAIISFIVLITMMKFVSESRKEIGILRAIGMKKFAVLIMFISQALLYIVIAFGAGAGIGIAANIVFSQPIGNAFNVFIRETIEKTFNVSAVVDTVQFSASDSTTIMVYGGILIFLGIVISLIPSYRASQISPVEAITG